MLNSDVLYVICSSLPSTVDLVTFSRVSKSWNAVSRKEDLWKQFYMREFDASEPEMGLNPIRYNARIFCRLLLLTWLSLRRPHSFQQKYAIGMRKINRLASCTSLTLLWQHNIFKPFAQNTLVVKGRHAVVAFNSYSTAVFKVLHLDTGQIVHEQSLQLSHPRQEIIAKTQDSSFIFIKDGKLLHRFDTTTFERVSFDLAPLPEQVQSIGTSRPFGLYPLNDRLVIIMTADGGSDQKLFCVDLILFSVVWEATLQAQVVLLLKDRLITYTFVDSGLQGMHSFRLSDGHHTLLSPQAPMFRIQAITSRCCFQPTHTDSILYELHNEKFSISSTMPGRLTMRAVSLSPILCELDHSGDLTITNIANPKLPKEILSLHVPLVRLHQLQDTVFDPETLNLVTLRYYNLCVWKFEA
jgi:hypothetical protein